MGQLNYTGHSTKLITIFLLIFSISFVPLNAQLDIVGHLFPKRHQNRDRERNQWRHPPMPMPSSGMTVPSGIWPAENPRIPNPEDNNWDEGFQDTEDYKSNDPYYENQPNSYEDVNTQPDNFRRPFKNRGRPKSRPPKRRRPPSPYNHQVENDYTDYYRSTPGLTEANWGDEPLNIGRPKGSSSSWSGQSPYENGGGRVRSQGRRRKPHFAPNPSINTFTNFDEYDKPRVPSHHQRYQDDNGGDDEFEDSTGQNPYSTIFRDGGKFKDNLMAPPPISSSNFYSSPSLTTDSENDGLSSPKYSNGRHHPGVKSPGSFDGLGGRRPGENSIGKQKQRGGSGNNFGSQGHDFNEDGLNNPEFSNFPGNRYRGNNRQKDTVKDSGKDGLSSWNQNDKKIQGDKESFGSSEDLMEEVVKFKGTGQMDPNIQDDPATQPIVHINLGKLVDDLSEMCSSLLPHFVDFGQKFCSTKPKASSKMDDGES